MTTALRRITALAEDRAIHRAFSWLHLHQPTLRRWQLEFLAIPAPPFHETARAHWFLEKFRTLNLHNPHLDTIGNTLAELPAAPRHDQVPQGFSLGSHNTVEGAGASAPGPNATPCLLLSAHLDTVFPPETDCTPTEDGPRILCPGASDNGAGLTALLAIAAALQHAKITPAAPILFAANVGEEGEGDLRGMRHLFSSDSPWFQRIRSSIALEGSGTGTVVDRALGSRRLRLTVHGPGGHSWADAGRPNPILALAQSLTQIAQLHLPTKPRTTLNVGTIRGGTSINSIPSTASADLDLRSTSSLHLDRLELSILQTFAASIETFASTPATAEIRFSVERIGDRPSGALAPSSPLFTSLKVVDRHLQIPTEPHIGSTDANLPLSLNIPALAIGCGGVGTGIHTLSETYDPTGRELALRRILLLVLDTAHLIAT
ncbi:MAG: M20/M25/M40 family metallo-hydrolase [Acidobacteriota bacterium]